MNARPASPASQRGAALLIAAVFLLAIIALIGGIGLRLAGTDITDTALQSDSVEALFLAESGLERAMQRLAGGTDCAALVPDSVQTLGRGEFQVVQTWDLGALCRVRVRARILSAGSLRAQRVIEADIQPAGGNTWAVGNGGTILGWDGSSWVPHVSGVTSDLNDVACASGSSCWAVGANGAARHWSGGAWVPGDTGIAGATTLNSVACVPDSADDCIAVGEWLGIFGAVYQYTGGSWNLIDLRLFADYTDAFCTPTECYAVGGSGLAGRRGGGWNIENADTGQDLNGVACTSANDCWAVGPRLGNGFFYDRRTAGGWSPQAVNDPGDRRDLYDVTCPAANDCWAVGERRAGNRYTLTHWNGSGWAANFVGLGDAGNLNAVSCADSNACWTVGDNGDTLRWSGGGWSAVPSGTTQDLNGVYAAPAGGGNAVTLQRWREIIS